MIARISLKMWLRKRYAPDDESWSVVYWQQGKETPGMRSVVIDCFRDQHDLLWKEKGFRVKSHAFNPVEMPEDERAKYFSLDEV